MSFIDTLRKLGIFRSGSVSGTYTNAIDRPTELQMEGVYNAEKDLVGGDKTKHKQSNDPKKDKNTKKINTLSLIGFVLAFIIPIAGLVCSIIGINQIKKRSEKGRGLAIAGLIVSILVGIFQLMVLIAVFAGNSITLTSYKDATAGYTVQYPKEWKITNQDANGAKSIAFKDEVGKTGKVTGQVEVVYVPAPSTGYSSDVIKAVRDSLVKSNNATTVVYESRGTKNGLDTLTLVTTYDGENGKIKSKTNIILKKDNSLVTVSTQSPEENWNKYQDKFDEIHNTFQP